MEWRRRAVRLSRAPYRSAGASSRKLRQLRILAGCRHSRESRVCIERVRLRRISLRPRSLTLDLRVQFRPGEDDVGAQIEPEQQDDDGAKRAVGLVVAADLRDVGRETNRAQDP